MGGTSHKAARGRMCCMLAHPASSSAARTARISGASIEKQGSFFQAALQKPLQLNSAVVVPCEQALRDHDPVARFSKRKGMRTDERGYPDVIRKADECRCLLGT